MKSNRNTACELNPEKKCTRTSSVTITVAFGGLELQNVSTSSLMLSFCIYNANQLLSHLT